MEIEVEKIFSRLKDAQVEDETAMLFNTIAFHRVKVLDKIEETLRIAMAKKIFLENNGLRVLMKYLEPIQLKKNEPKVEPCIAIKMKVFNLILNLDLKSDEISEYGAGIYTIVSKNRHRTNIPELKELCIQVLKSWDYAMFRDLTVRKRKKK